MARTDLRDFRRFSCETSEVPPARSCNGPRPSLSRAMLLAGLEPPPATRPTSAGTPSNALRRRTSCGSAATHRFGGNGERLDPEQLLVAAASSCQLLSFLAVAARARLDVLSYEDEAEADMPEDEKPCVCAESAFVSLIRLREGPDAARVHKLVEQAHHECSSRARSRRPSAWKRGSSSYLPTKVLTDRAAMVHATAMNDVRALAAGLQSQLQLEPIGVAYVDAPPAGVARRAQPASCQLIGSAPPTARFFFTAAGQSPRFPIGTHTPRRP